MPFKPANYLVQLIFFGNYFYGLCTIGLSIEAELQQRFPLNEWYYYVLLYAVTVLYYTKAYIDETSAKTSNMRLLWYRHHRRFVIVSQVFLTIIALIIAGFIMLGNWNVILKIQLYEWVLIFIFPFVAGLYYGIAGKTIGRYNLRNIGWLKPFIIGFVWGGLVTVYPILFHNIVSGQHYQITFIGCLLLLKNTMFVTVLCIMFDIKDYAMDYNHQLKTFVVKAGLRKTIFAIIIPLCILGLGTFLVYGFTHGFSAMKMLLNTIPFILLILVAFSLKNRRPIMYYLIIIDGLMFVKAVCGSIAMVYF